MFVVCPVCEIPAPRELFYTSRKWRWMTVHMASHSKGAHKPAVPTRAPKGEAHD